MPYCPKCDMEFIDGITVCSDCGGPLLSSREEAEALLLKAREQEEELRNAAAADFSDSEDLFEASGESAKSAQDAARARADSRAYVSKRQRLEDMRSSVSAFAMVGAVLTVFGLLCFAKVIRLPLGSGSMMLFQSVLTLMGVGSLLIALITKKSSAAMAVAADEEDARTKELTEWFAGTYTASDLDDRLLSEDPALEGNELYLKRFELIQDYLTVNHDLPDQNYVDFLCEEIYARIFEA